MSFRFVTSDAEVLALWYPDGPCSEAKEVLVLIIGVFYRDWLFIEAEKTGKVGVFKELREVSILFSKLLIFLEFEEFSSLTSLS